MIRWFKENEERIIANVQYSNYNLEDLTQSLIIANKYYMNMLMFADKFIEWLDEPTKSMVKDKYINEIIEVELELEYGYTYRHIRKIINKYIDEYLKN